MKDHPDADHVELKMIGKTFKCTKYQDSWKELPKDLPQNSRGAMLQILLPAALVFQEGGTARF
jgi:hypothetical protein